MREKVKVITMPLTPTKGEYALVKKSERIRPATSLDLHYVLQQLRPSIVAAWHIKGKRWLLANVLSAYSATFHTMLIESSPGRHVPSPEYVDDEEGECLAEHMRTIVEFLTEQDRDAKISLGYNWSPRSFGVEEEKGGYQSLLRLHWHIWRHPLDSDRTYVQWVDLAALKPEERRVHNNTYGVIFGRQFVRCLEQEGIFKWSGTPRTSIDHNGLEVVFQKGLLELLCAKVFTRLIKPIARRLDRLFRDITECVTTIDCGALDAALRSAVENPTQGNIAEQLGVLRSRPEAREYVDASALFDTHGLSSDILKEIYKPVQNRCTEETDPHNRWRKCFGYAWVLTGNRNGNACLRIQPGLYIGPGGVVEAQGMVLRRPIARWASEDTIGEKSQILDSLRERLQRTHSEEE